MLSLQAVLIVPGMGIVAGMPAKPLQKAQEQVKGRLGVEQDSSRGPASVDDLSVSIGDESNKKITTGVAMVCC